MPRLGNFLSFVSSSHTTYLGEKSFSAKASSNNVEFEKEFIDLLLKNGRSFGRTVEYSILHGFFNLGGKLENEEYFYQNISGICGSTHGRGYDLIYVYAKRSLKKRLPEDVEKVFFSNIWKAGYYAPKSAYKYAKYVVRGRLPVELEKGCESIDYVNFLMSKGIDATDILLNDTCLSLCFYKNNHYLPDSVHNYMIGMNLCDDRYAKKYFITRKKEDKLLKGRLKTLDQSKTVAEVLKEM